jgi:outer membrane protein
MRSTNYVGCSAGLLAALALGTAAAQTSTNIKIGVVNMTALIEQSPQTQELMAKLREEFAPRQREIATMEQTLKTKQETYQRDSSVMGNEERANLEREIRDGQRELQRAGDQATEDFNIRRNEALGELQRTIVLRVQEYARNAGFDLVLYEAVYASDAINITADVLATLGPSTAQGSNSPPANP